MTLQNNNIWLPSGSGSLANGELCYDNSTRPDHKRGHHWFLDTSEQDLFFNKKQAIESINGTPGPAAMESSLWHGGSNSHLESQRGNCSNFPKPVQIPIVSASVSMKKKIFENQCGNESSICLSMSHAAENPLFLNTGLRKIKENEVTIPENCLHQLVGNSSFFSGEENKMMSSSSTFQRTGHINTCPGLTYNNTTNVNNFFNSVGQASSKTDGSTMLPNQFYNGIDNNLLSIGQTFNRGNYNLNTNGNLMSIGPTYGRSHDNYFAVDPLYSKVNEQLMPASCAYNKDDSDVISYTKENSNKSERTTTTTICFGGFQGNPEERDLISGYGALLNQSSGQPMESSGQKDSQVQQTANVTSAATSKADGAKKAKEVKTKKGSSNNFPSNVKSLLSTGIFDGVPVKYVSWSREKNLRGMVKGTGYLCSCQDCKLAKSVNAYDFERHAGCKTKHPNNHIYFENGKTIYAVVQELKGTSQEMLFEVIKNVTGSAVNQKNFNTWKGSYQAATRELQRIYGKDETVAAS